MENQNTSSENLINNEVSQKEKSTNLNFNKQLKILLYKQFLIFKRLKKQIIFLIIGPIIVNLLVVFVEGLITSFYDKENPNPKVTQRYPFYICQSSYFTPKTVQRGGCNTLDVAIIDNLKEEDRDDGWIRYVLFYLSAQSKIETGMAMPIGYDPYSRIRITYEGEDPTAQGFFDRVKQKPNVNTGLILCNSFIKIGDELIDCKHPKFKYGPQPEFKRSYYYTIMRHHEDPWNRYDVSNTPLAYAKIDTPYKQIIDNALIVYEKYKDKLPTMTYEEIEKTYNERPIQLSLEAYPYATSRFNNNTNIIGWFGSLYYFLMPMYIFIIIVNEFTHEKFYRLRQGLNIYGISHVSYWLSWIILGVILGSFVSLYTILLGYAFQFEFFLDSNFILLFGMFLIFSMSLMGVALVISTLVSDLKTGVSISYLFVLFSIVVEFFLSQDQVMNSIYADDKQDYTSIKIIKIIGYFYPPYTYALLFKQISQFSGYHLDGFQQTWFLGPGFGFEHLFSEIKGEFTGVFQTGNFTLPSPAFGYMIIMIQICFYLALALYFDAIIDNNRGAGLPATFLCQKKTYQRRKRIKSTRNTENQTYRDEDDILKQIQEKKINEGNSYSINDSLLQSDNQSGFRTETEYNLEQQQFNRIMIVQNLFKTYQSGNMCHVTFKKALRNISFTFNQGEIYTILGHNGSGKTTLINILTGILSYDKGKVLIDSLDLENDLEEMRKLVGVCPQFDILWDFLTPGEHFRIFGEIRGLNKDEIIKETKEKLDAVKLSEHKHAYVKSFSGGMKRRLSLALSSLGNPSFIFLDEPTTGMDPKIRKEIWNLIQDMKKKTGIILTTHYMEEAEQLSDYISVIANGKVKASGNSLFLKNKYGGGYKISLNSNKEYSEQIESFMKKAFLDSELQENKGGQMTFQLPLMDIKQIKKFFQIMEIDEEECNQKQDILGVSWNEIQKFKTLIFDWGVSHPTLEEVFLTITKKELKS